LQVAQNDANPSFRHVFDVLFDDSAVDANFAEAANLYGNAAATDAVYAADTQKLLLKVYDVDDVRRLDFAAAG
jgi:hypothetical protein